jgi:hypothetical protein
MAQCLRNALPSRAQASLSQWFSHFTRFYLLKRTQQLKRELYCPAFGDDHGQYDAVTATREVLKTTFTTLKCDAPLKLH